jgi:hypothetical protein
MKTNVKMTAREKLMFKLGRKLENYWETGGNFLPAHERREFRALRLLDEICDSDNRKGVASRIKAQEDLYAALMCEIIALNFVGKGEIPIGKLMSIYDDFRALGVRDLPIHSGVTVEPSDEEDFWS